ncbi:TBC1 domain family member 10B-like [Narcine bancroftii]|uniref:TBC1 domain family member 10B-like n=1 Tax=Narcine bancroftii TaxID=1343680 RepID=UPI0038310008
MACTPGPVPRAPAPAPGPDRAPDGPVSVGNARQALSAQMQSGGAHGRPGSARQALSAQMQSGGAHGRPGSARQALSAQMQSGGAHGRPGSALQALSAQVQSGGARDRTRTSGGSEHQCTGSMHAHPTPGSVHEDQTPGRVHADPTPNIVHADPTPDFVHADFMLDFVHADSTLDFVHADSTLDFVLADSTLDFVHADPTPDLVHTDPTPDIVHTELTPGTVYADPTPGSVHTDSTPGSVHADPIPRIVHTDLTPGTVYVDPTPGSMHTDSTAGNVHADPIPCIVHTDPTPSSVHKEPALGSVHADPIPESELADPIPRIVHTDHTPCSVHAKRTLASVPPDQCQGAGPLHAGVPPLSPAPLLSQHPLPHPAPDTISVADSTCGPLESASMYGTMESLFPGDASSVGSDSEVNGSTVSGQRTDKYGFLGGGQFSSGLESAIPVDVARLRELKWLEMLSRWDKWLARRFDKVKVRCRKGIPSSLRARAWQQMSRSKQLMEQNPGKFEELDRQPGDPKWLDIIEKDLHRQFPFHEMFALRGGHGQQDLYRILKAYTVYRPEEGYCQAQAPVAAVLLMHMPAEQAFWCLVQICEKYLPGYYSAGLEAIQLDGEILSALLRRVSPLAFRHLKKHRIDPILYMTEWFMCIFARTLPWASVLRVWDMFFCDGVKVVFKVGLVLLRHVLGSKERLHDCGGMYETMERLRSLPLQRLPEDVLVSEVISLNVPEALIERETRKQRQRWCEERGDLQYRPSRRLYGARAILEEESRLNPPLAASPSLRSLTASLASLRRGTEVRGSIASLVLPFTPPQPGALVVSEGLHAPLPSPTSSLATFGDPRKERERERREREREKKEAERQRKETEKQRKETEKQRKEAERQRKEEEKQRKEAERKEREQERERERKERKERKERERKRVPPKSEGNKENGASEGVSKGFMRDQYF